VDNGEKREREVDNDVIMYYHCSLVVGCNTLLQYRRPVFLDFSSSTYVSVAGVSSFHSIHPKLISVFLTHGNPGILLEELYERLQCCVHVMSCHVMHACMSHCICGHHLQSSIRTIRDATNMCNMLITCVVFPW
jgi:hypothetical protein